MTYDTETPAEALRSLQDSIRSAESIYDHGESLVFATERQVVGLNIAIEKILEEFHPGREDRIGTLRILFNRLPGRFHSSRDMTFAGARALRDRLYGADAFVDRDTEILSDAKMAVREAYLQHSGQTEMFHA